MLKQSFLARTLLTGLLGLGFFSPLFVFGADGPVKDLEKAIKSGKKEILFEGKENEDITIKKGVSIIGTSPAKASINNNIVMENGSSLSNVTVNGKGTTITIAKGASVTLSNVTVRGGTFVGIHAPTGAGTLTIKNSRITKNRKGFYIQPGKSVYLVGNVISENKEEGLDMRADIYGTISGNQFINNGEGGAEMIAGSGRLTVSGNTFAGNKASGLAIQSYENRNIPGNITLSRNTFANNNDYGLTCGSPSGGGGGRSFFAASIKSLGNTFRGNKKGTINSSCGIANQLIEEKTEDEKKAEAKEEEDIPVVDEAALRREQEVLLSEKAKLLHAAEYALEKGLFQAEEEREWWEEPWKVLSPGETARFVEEIRTINTLRDEISSLPRDEYSLHLEEDRQMIVLTSLQRMEELRQYFERLQKQQYPSWWLLLW